MREDLTSGVLFPVDNKKDTGMTVFRMTDACVSPKSNQVVKPDAYSCTYKSQPK